MAAQPLPFAPRPHTIRPWRLFTALSTSADRVAQVPIPPRRAYGGLTLLETFLLVSTCRLVDAQCLFEFGTFLGSTTLVLALNSAPSARVFTLDLDAETHPTVSQHEADAPLTAIHHNAAHALDFMNTAVERKITSLRGDSLRLDFSPYYRQMDWIFIDAGHDLVSVRSDTENAFRMINPDRLSCVLWHDYQNPDYPDLTRYLDDISQERPMFHVGDTMLCLWINDPAHAILPTLLE
ncbi:MAG TPA: class I SAM-dependent methyltransferase [Acidobacteriaceae bacterium]|nr:class I SAM-dependent methyltransferase [Acidobacteriaceae bacterium]